MKISGLRSMMTTMKLCQILFVGVCLYVVFSGTHPPMQAQHMDGRQNVVIPVVTTEDALQDRDIEEMGKHIDSTDLRMQKQWDVLNAQIAAINTNISKNAADISGTQSETRLFAGILGIIVSAGFVSTIRNKGRSSL